MAGLRDKLRMVVFHRFPKAWFKGPLWPKAIIQHNFATPLARTQCEILPGFASWIFNAPLTNSED